MQKLNNEAGGHPHVCAVYDIYEGDDTYWMSMELIEGGELFEHLIEEGAFSEASSFHLIRSHNVYEVICSRLSFCFVFI